MIEKSPLLDARKRDTCVPNNEYNGLIGVRISAIFVILIAGSLGSFLPVVASKHSKINLPNWVFFTAKYFGSGVIVATAFIHLLEPATDSLGEDCLPEAWHEYPYAFAITLLASFMTFFVEIITGRLLARKGIDGNHDHGPGMLASHGPHGSNDNKPEDTEIQSVSDSTSAQSYDSHTPNWTAQLGAIFILEFGIIFHSVFMGLTLAVAGDEFKTLYIVMCFHQLFEGLGLGTRIAAAPWPDHKRWLPWSLAAAFGLATPVAIAIGLGVRKTYLPGSYTSLVTQGIFDAISAGILIYTGFVELIGNEFLHSSEFKKAQFTRILLAFGVMCLGAALMALLGKWA